MPKTSPPKLAKRFLYWHCDPELLEEIEGDLNEEFDEIAAEKSPFKARLFYLLEVVRFMRMYKPKQRIKNLNRLDMLLNNFKMAFRNMRKHKAYAAINLLGLIIGITCSFLIFLYVKAESSFDKFHEQSADIYRIQHSYSFMNAQAGPAYKVLSQKWRTSQESTLGLAIPGFLCPISRSFLMTCISLMPIFLMSFHSK